MSAGKKWDDLPGYAKGVVVILAAVATTAVIGGTIYGIRSVIKRIAENKDPKKTVADAQKEIDAIKNDPTKPAFYPQSTYDAWANSIQSLLQDCTFGSNDMAVWNIMTQLHTDRDYLELLKAFGVRTMRRCTVLPIGNESQWDLPTTLKTKLTENTINGINRVFAAGRMKSKI